MSETPICDTHKSDAFMYYHYGYGWTCDACFDDFYEPFIGVRYLNTKVKGGLTETF